VTHHDNVAFADTLKKNKPQTPG